MMMKVNKRGWAGAEAGGWTKSKARKGRSRAGQEQGRSRVEAGWQELSRSRGRSKSRAGGG